MIRYVDKGKIKMVKDPEFTKKYGIDSIEYRFKFYNTDEREMHKAIIHKLVEALPNIILAKDNE